jgi:hypothetical protein
MHQIHVPQLSLLWSDAALRLLSFAKMYAMATLAPRLEWPRDRQNAPPTRSRPFASNFVDGLLENFLSLALLVAALVVEDLMPSMVSNPGGIYVEEKVSNKTTISVLRKMTKPNTCSNQSTLLADKRKKKKLLKLTETTSFLPQRHG